MFKLHKGFVQRLLRISGSGCETNVFQSRYRPLFYAAFVTRSPALNNLTLLLKFTSLMPRHWMILDFCQTFVKSSHLSWNLPHTYTPQDEFQWLEFHNFASSGPSIHHRIPFVPSGVAWDCWFLQVKGRELTPFTLTPGGNLKSPILVSSLKS